MIHHVQLACPAGSEDVLRRFYRDLLGLVEKAKPAVLAARGGCWFATPIRSAGAPGGPEAESESEGFGIELHLGVEADFRPARKAHPGLLWPDLDGLAERLAAAGYPVDWSDELPGYRRFYTDDPHGNRLEFLTVRSDHGHSMSN